MERNYNRKENGGSRKPVGRNFRKESYDRNFNNERRERQDGERRERRSFGKERFNSERRDLLKIERHSGKLLRDSGKERESGKIRTVRAVSI